MRYFDQDMSLAILSMQYLISCCHPIPKCQEKVWNDIFQKMQKRRRSFLTGHRNELNGKKIENSKHGNLVVDVVCNKMLCNSCVIITTRPHRIMSVKEFSRYSPVVVDGFSEESVFEFISKFIKVNTFRNEEDFSTIFCIIRITVMKMVHYFTT